MKDSTEKILEVYGRYYKEYVVPLTVFAYRFVDRYIAEDMVQDVFLSMLRNKVVIDDTTMENYLFQSVKNACLNNLRHQAIEDEFISRSILEIKMMELNYNDMRKFQNKEQIRIVYKAINLLPDRMREIFILYYLNEKKSDQIAEMLNISKRTVETEIYKGLKLIRKMVLSKV